MTSRPRQILTRLAPVLALVAVMLLVAACIPGTTTTPSGGSPSFSQAPLTPASPSANPIDLLAWLFNPIFQTLFIALVLLDQATYWIWPETGNMVVAIILSMIVMLLFAGKVSAFIDKHPTLKVLALSFLILIGVLLVAEGIGTHFNKGYIYFAMAFSLVVEMINMRIRKPAPVIASDD